jgi:hypothetical protein
LLTAKHGQPLFPDFDGGFVDPVELEEFAVSLTDFLFDVTLPKISSQAEGAVGLFVEGDVVWTFELDHIIAFGLVFAYPRASSFWSRVNPNSWHAERRASMSLICVLISVK